MRNFVEESLEKFIFASRWFLAPIYIVLSISLFFITIKVIQEFLHFAPLVLSMQLKDMMLFVLHVVDLALVGNLVLMIIFAGYENFVSKISVADKSEDKPSWMGKVDFSELKLKLIASIVAISGINLLETFMDISSISDREVQWMIIIHLVFIFSGVFLALMDFIASKSNAH
jgi:uncharacterized protein (TIGR00645 family)